MDDVSWNAGLYRRLSRGAQFDDGRNRPLSADVIDIRLRQSGAGGNQRPSAESIMPPAPHRGSELIELTNS